MNDIDIKPILEGILFTSESPVRMETLAEILPEWSAEAISDGIERIKKEWEDGLKGLELVEIAGGYQFRTKSQWADYIHRLKKKKPVKLSQSALETLAIIAYRQPVIRPEIEEIRGVDSGWVVRTLLEKGLIRMMGRKDLPGRPIVYGTTKAFLEVFSLSSLTDLPTLKEILPPPSPEEVSQEDIAKTEVGSTIPQEISAVEEVKDS
jgi:segregation and condensation protein B